MSKRAYDIVVWGATGFTGTLIAEYLAAHAPDTLKWAIGGRSKDKLQKIKDSLVKLNPSTSNVGVLIGDAGDQSSVDAIVKQARVVLSAAGPFHLYGTPVVDACVRLGTDFCDLTGETHWIKEMHDKYHEQAKKNGVHIVNSCGLDSVPSDLGAFMVADYVKEKYTSELEECKIFVTRFKGGVSGGSIATAISYFSDPNLIKEGRDPYYGVPPELKPKEKAPADQKGFSYDYDAKLWAYPYPLGQGENRFVRRSQALLGYRYGNFKFSVAQGTASFFTAFTAVIGFFVTWLLGKLKPPGSGPARNTFDKGGFTSLIIAKPKKKGGVPQQIRGHVNIEGDPGYYKTATMISECALCLATQRDQLLNKQGGVLTPSSCMGNVLLERLRNVDIQFYVDEE